MNKEEILQRSREENRGYYDERESKVLADASRIGMGIGGLACILLVLLSEFIFHSSDAGIAGWFVYIVMQGSYNLSLFRALHEKGKLIWGIIEIILACAFAIILVLKNVV